MFGATSTVKNSYKEKYVQSGYGIAFDGKGEWNFGNDFARNVIIFRADNSSSSHTDNLINDFLILGEGDTPSINRSFGAAEKKIDINISKAKAQYSLSLHYNSDNSYLFMNGKEIYKFKASPKNNVSSRFCLGIISNEFNINDLNEVS